MSPSRPATTSCSPPSCGSGSARSPPARTSPGDGLAPRGEAFGDDFELPADRAYIETCAAVASVMLSWRLLLATGEARFADLAERTLYNVVAASTSLDGRAFFYTNPLQQRSRAKPSTVPGRGRVPAPVSGRRGATSPAARPTWPAPSPPSAATSPPRTAAGSSSTSTRAAP
ncbi:beta-L-arabinofuranosidase domain-containing protein [Phytohabitans flavus]|uniref:beta-L-arabinofuranosidase domain-containing protein n=1 Tax=Phytohabitans flavus TaxID=1076124 RepID=UPI003634A528